MSGESPRNLVKLIVQQVSNSPNVLSIWQVFFRIFSGYEPAVEMLDAAVYRGNHPAIETRKGEPS